MTTFTEHTTLADIVTAQPGLARELENRGLDYCCGGAATLANACSANDLDVDTVLVELAAVEVDATTPSWAAMDVAALRSVLDAPLAAPWASDLPVPASVRRLVEES